MYACFRLIMTKPALVKARYEDSHSASMRGSNHLIGCGQKFQKFTLASYSWVSKQLKNPYSADNSPGIKGNQLFSVGLASAKLIRCLPFSILVPDWSQDTCKDTKANPLSHIQYMQRLGLLLQAAILLFMSQKRGHAYSMPSTWCT